jgi:hypothetical protein
MGGRVFIEPSGKSRTVAPSVPMTRAKLYAIAGAILGVLVPLLIVLALCAGGGCAGRALPEAQKPERTKVSR